MMSEQQFYYIYTDYDLIITNLNEKLNNFKLKNPAYDISEQLNVINTLRFLQNTFHKQYHLLLSLEGQHGKWIGERNRLINIINDLEKENKNLKESINI